MTGLITVPYPGAPAGFLSPRGFMESREGDGPGWALLDRDPEKYLWPPIEERGSEARKHGERSVVRRPPRR